MALQAWQQDYLPGAFFIYPPQEVREKINPLRAQYSPNSQSYCDAHITLTHPLTRQPTPDEWQQFHTIAAGFSPFTVTYGPLQTWMDGQIIYFAIQPQEPILVIRQAFHEVGLFDLTRPFTEGFIAHMTVMEGQEGVDPVTPEQGMAIYESLKDVTPGGSFLCESIAFLKPDENFHFELKDTLNFRS